MALTKSLVLLALVLLPWCCDAAEPVGLVTIADGDSFVVRRAQKIQLKVGSRLYAQDLLQTGPQSVATRVELASGGIFDLGPASLGILRPGLPGSSGSKGAALYLLKGWFKVGAVPTSAAGSASVMAEPLEIANIPGSAVLSVQPQSVQVFAETGALSVLGRQSGKSAAPAAPAGPAALAAGGLYAARVGERATVSARVPAAFIQSVPKGLQDSIPALASNFKARPEPAAKALGELSYQDATPWLQAEPQVRKLLVELWKDHLPGDLRQGLGTHIDAHPEWRSTLFPEKDRVAKTPVWPATSP